MQRNGFDLQTFLPLADVLACFHLILLNSQFTREHVRLYANTYRLQFANWALVPHSEGFTAKVM